MITNLLKSHSIIGVCANRNEAKTSLCLHLLKGLREQYPTLKIATLGVNPELQIQLNALGVTYLHSKMELLDLRLRDTIIFVDEFALLFDTDSKNKQLDKLMRFFDRIEHQNCKLIIATAREGYYNKFMCGRINAFLVKQTEYAALVNGTWLKERVMAITTNTSDYRLECAKGDYFIVSTDIPTTKESFPYDAMFDTKKNNISLFPDIKAEKKSRKKAEIKTDKLAVA